MFTTYINAKKLLLKIRIEIKIKNKHSCKSITILYSFI